MGGVLIDLDFDRCVAAYKAIGFEEICDYLDPCHQKGYGIYILSNNNPIMMRICDSDFKKVGIGITDFFDQAFISSSMKMMKPGAEIFKEAIRRIGLNPDELLFIDDSPVNVAGAEAVGMKAVLYTPGEDLRKIVENAL